MTLGPTPVLHPPNLPSSVPLFPTVDPAPAVAPADTAQPETAPAKNRDASTPSFPLTLRTHPTPAHHTPPKGALQMDPPPRPH